MLRTTIRGSSLGLNGSPAKERRLSRYMAAREVVQLLLLVVSTKSAHFLVEHDSALSIAAKLTARSSFAPDIQGC